MAFTYSSGVITQTGTDTNLTGLAGLTGVTVYNSVYLLDNVFLRVKGTLSFNGYTERMVFVNPNDSGTGLNYMSIYVDTGASLTVSCDNGVASAGFVQTNTSLPCIDFGTRAIAGPGGATAYNGGRKFFSVHPSGSIALTGVFVGKNSNSQGIISSFDGTSELVDCIMMTKTELSNVQYSFKGTVLIRRTSLLGAPLADRGGAYTFDGFTVGEALEGFLFGGAVVSNAHTTVVDFATYNTSAQDIRINMSSTNTYGTVILVDSQKDAPNTVVSMQDNDGFNFCVWQSNLTLNFLDTDLNPTDVKVYAQDVNNGSRFGTIVVRGGTDISDSTKTYQGTTTSGSISFQPYTAFSRKISSVYTIDNRGNADGSNITFPFYNYGKLVGNVTPTLVGNGVKAVTSTVLPNPSITEANKATVDSYTEIDTSNKFYDRAASYLEDNLGTYLAFILTRQGALIDAGAYNVTIDATASSAFAISGNTITIKASTFTGDMTTTGVITLANGATFNGTRTDANGTIVPSVTYSLQLPNIIDGSRFQIYNVTTASELNNAVVAGGSGINVSYTKGTEYTAGDVGRYRVSYQNGVNAKDTIEGSFTFAAESTVNSLPTTQVAFDNYTTFGVDGSTISEFSWDSGNIEVDVNDADNSTTVQRFAAWYYYFITTAVGVDDAFGGILWENINSIRINAASVSVKIDNTKTTPLILTGGRLYRTDGATVIASLSGSIQVDYDPVYTVSTGVSGLTPTESAKLTAVEGFTTELHKIRGLSLGNPVTMTPTSIESDDIDLTISGDGSTTSTITRNA